MADHVQQEEEKPTVNLDTSRRSAHEIFEDAAENGRKELERPAKALAFSGVAGGVTMGLTGMAVAIVLATLSSLNRVIGGLKTKEPIEYVLRPAST